ncbi:hypothetical protein JUM41_11265 [Rhizobium pusense]|uniref:hypothetical protein n=1 Tax=Agrobacterium pusense TaxID=648995 RepID=UPI001FCBD474|nr:hypothetical protein [Agrobacterium pusense]MCJ2874815.1 hypothetical protein [Agrobacterium pusense]
MSEHQKKRLVVLFWLVICVTILPPIFFGEPRSVKDQVGGDSWRNFIYDFQTLIGGGAAIIAAWYTVRQMQFTDEKSELRHRELVALQLRSDRLRVERMVFPSLADLLESWEVIAAFKGDVLRSLVADEPKTVAHVANELNKDCSQALKILSRATFRDAVDLLDGEMTYLLAKLDDGLKMLRDDCRKAINLADEAARPEHEFNLTHLRAINEALHQRLEIVDDKRIDVLNLLQDVCGRMETMGREYSIHKAGLKRQQY